MTIRKCISCFIPHEDRQVSLEQFVPYWIDRSVCVFQMQPSWRHEKIQSLIVDFSIYGHFDPFPGNVSSNDSFIAEEYRASCCFRINRAQPSKCSWSFLFASHSRWSCSRCCCSARLADDRSNTSFRSSPSYTFRSSSRRNLWNSSTKGSIK